MKYILHYITKTMDDDKDEEKKKSYRLRRKYYVVEKKYLIEEEYYDEEEEKNINYDLVSIDHELKLTLEKFYRRCHHSNFIIQLIDCQDGDRFITIHHKLEFKRINSDWIEGYLFIQNKNEKYMILYKITLPQRGGDYACLLNFLKKFNLSPVHDFIDHDNQTRVLEFIVLDYHPLIVAKMMVKAMKQEL